MRKVLILLFLLYGFACFSQGGPKVDAIKFRGKITTAIRDALDVPTGEEWIIYNITNDRFETSGDDNSWTAFSTDDQTAPEVPFAPVDGISSTNVQEAIMEVKEENLQIASEVPSNTFSGVPNNPFSDFSSTDVQGALEELGAEKLDLLGSNRITGDLRISKVSSNLRLFFDHDNDFLELGGGAQSEGPILTITDIGITAKNYDNNKIRVNGNNLTTVNYVFEELLTKQNTLISGNNIKTINGESILGFGNLEVSGGGTAYTAGPGLSLTGNEFAVDPGNALFGQWDRDASDDVTTAADLPLADTGGLFAVDNVEWALQAVPSFHDQAGEIATPWTPANYAPSQQTVRAHLESIDAALGSAGGIPDDNSVTSAKIVDGQVTDNDIADGAITDIKVQSSSLTPSRLVAGSEGQVIKTVSGVPVWADQAGGGSGDFLADGSVPMTGNLRLGGNDISNIGEVFTDRLSFMNDVGTSGFFAGIQGGTHFRMSGAAGFSKGMKYSYSEDLWTIDDRNILLGGIPGRTGTSPSGILLQTDVELANDGNPGSDEVVICTTCPLVDTLTGTSVALSDTPVYIDDRSTDNNTFTFSNLAIGREATIDLNQSGVPIFSASGATFSRVSGQEWEDNVRIQARFQVQSATEILYYFLRLW